MFSFYHKNKKTMLKQQSSGDVTCLLGAPGLSFTIAPERQLTFAAAPGSNKLWTRVLASTLMSIGLWSLPLFSHAATYTGADIIAQTNTVRAEHGLTALTTDADLDRAAQAKASDMFAQQYFNHYAPSGTAPWKFFTDYGYHFTSAGENLAIDFVDGHDIVPAWMGSADHRVNLLNASYRDVGVAVLDGQMNGQPTTLVVQFFGSRRAATPPPAQPTTPVATLTKPVITVTPPPPTPIITTTVTPSGPATIPPPVLVEAPVVSTLPAPITQPTPAVQGATIRVIPTLNITPYNNSDIDPQIAAIILATFGFYTALLSGAWLISRLLAQLKQISEPSINQAVV